MADINEIDFDDGDETLGRKELAKKLVDEFLQSEQEIPFSSAIGAKLIALINKPVELVNIDELVELLETDAGFAGRLLQLANSAHFCRLEKIGDLRRAIVQVGLEETINFMQLAYYQTILPKMPSLGGLLSDQDYWKYSWATAFAAKVLGHPSIGGKALPGELYIAGLLHAVGRVVLSVTRPLVITKVLQKSKGIYHLPIEDLQLDIIGTTDADISRELLSKWQLPENICKAVGHIYHPEEAKGEIREFAAFLQLSCCIVKSFDGSFLVSGGCDKLSATWMATSSSLPLADPIFLSEKAEEITAALQARKDIFIENKGDEESEDGEYDGEEEGSTEEQQPPAPPTPAPRQAPAKPAGFFQQLLGWILELFSG